MSLSDEQLRRRYLKAMGIPLWERRSRQPAAATASSGSIQALQLASAVTMADDPSSSSKPGLTAEAKLSVPTPDAVAPSAESAPPAEQTARLNPTDNQQLNAELELDEADPRAAHIARLDWDTLQADVSGCVACSLHQSRTQTVFGVGNRHAHWLIIGEAPGADEDRLGEPFVGRAGKLLDAMLAALKLDREQVYIANILKCRPPKNRDPLPEEAQCCWPYLARQIDLIKPRIILAVGRIAAQRLLQTEVAIGKLRGQVHRLPGAQIPVIVSYHPAYLLRSPREKRKAWADLQLAQRVLAAQSDRTLD